RVPSERRERWVHVHDPEAESAVHERARLRVVHPADRIADVLRGLRDPLLRHDANARVPAGFAEVLEISLADQRLLDQDADLGMAALREQVRPEDRLVGERALGKREGPLAQPIVGAGHADRRNPEALLDRLARRNTVVGDARAEDREAALLDELTV